MEIKARDVIGLRSSEVKQIMSQWNSSWRETGKLWGFIWINLQRKV